MPSKASLPSALVEPTDIPPLHSLDNSVGRQSKQSSSRSKPSSNSSEKDHADGHGDQITHLKSKTTMIFLISKTDKK